MDTINATLRTLRQTESVLKEQLANVLISIEKELAKQERLSALNSAEKWFIDILDKYKFKCKFIPSMMTVELIHDICKVHYDHRGLKMFHFGRITWKCDDNDYFCDGMVSYKSKKVTMDLGTVIEYTPPKKKRRIRALDLDY
jgi:hypothetical protein